MTGRRKRLRKMMRALERRSRVEARDANVHTWIMSKDFKPRGFLNSLTKEQRMKLYEDWRDEPEVCGG